MSTLIKPPFSAESAVEKVQLAEDLWNTRNPQKIALAYTIDSTWRNRDVFLEGREEIVKFLTEKWEREKHYQLEKELFSFNENRIAVHFVYEYQSENNQWHRAYGNEHWEFDEEGLMKNRDASINEIAIEAKHTN